MINFMSFYVYNKKENMIKEFINYILDIAKYHKAINYVGYKRNININDGHNTKYYQFIIEDECFLEKQLIEGILTLRLDIVIINLALSPLPKLSNLTMVGTLFIVISLEGLILLFNKIFMS